MKFREGLWEGYYHGFVERHKEQWQDAQTGMKSLWLITLILFSSPSISQTNIWEISESDDLPSLDQNTLSIHKINISEEIYSLLSANDSVQLPVGGGQSMPVKLTFIDETQL